MNASPKAARTSAYTGCAEGLPTRPAGPGLSDAEIAAQLYPTENTVRTHVAHILRKLQVRDRVQAVILAHRAHLA